jgi:hypothetical protein
LELFFGLIIAPVYDKINMMMQKLQGIGLTTRRLVVLLGCFILFVLVMDFNSRLSELFTLNSQKNELETEVAQLTATLVSLGTQAAYADSTQAVEDWARTGHKGREGDIPIVILPPAAATPLPPTYNEPTPLPVNNWEVWWALFFGE